MSFSVTEISALATKAARGAGAPAGQAARFGPVAARHMQAGRDAKVLTLALDALPCGPIIELPRTLDAALTRAAPLVQADPLLQSYLDVLPFLATYQDDSGRLEVDRQRPAPVHTGRIRGYAALIAQMEQLAARTFVPDSAASREAGAGAGLTDND